MDRRLLRGVILVLAIFSSCFSFAQHFGSWIIVEKNYFAKKVVDPGSGLQLPQIEVFNIMKMRNEGIQGAIVQPLDRYEWGYVYALGAHPLSRKFESENSNLSRLLPACDSDVVYFIVPKSASSRMVNLESEVNGWRATRLLVFKNSTGCDVAFFKAGKLNTDGEIR